MNTMWFIFYYYIFSYFLNYHHYGGWGTGDVADLFFSKKKIKNSRICDGQVRLELACDENCLYAAGHECAIGSPWILIISYSDQTVSQIAYMCRAVTPLWILKSDLNSWIYTTLCSLIWHWHTFAVMYNSGDIVSNWIETLIQFIRIVHDRKNW